mmetsp:Transcript_34678/g.81297  ORF Transcript_34678/g.81297 Transcript_34678/m.81297 type:complete len:288 (+) Transcript_34678:191-1054(+)
MRGVQPAEPARAGGEQGQGADMLRVRQAPRHGPHAVQLRAALHPQPHDGGDNAGGAERRLQGDCRRGREREHAAGGEARGGEGAQRPAALHQGGAGRHPAAGRVRARQPRSEPKVQGTRDGGGGGAHPGRPPRLPGRLPEAPGLPGGCGADRGGGGARGAGRHAGGDDDHQPAAAGERGGAEHHDDDCRGAGPGGAPVPLDAEGAPRHLHNGCSHLHQERNHTRARHQRARSHGLGAPVAPAHLRERGGGVVLRHRCQARRQDPPERPQDCQHRVRRLPRRADHQRA